MTASTFEHVEAYRSELRAHCYRMLGSAFDADDAVQETLVRAWRSLGRFEGRTTLRGWLYRIATNVCLTMLRQSKKKRLTPYLSSPATTELPDGPLPEVAWLEPYPTPDEQYERKEATELAFVAAIAYLPPRQRAALLLSDVLGWSAIETAGALDATVAAVNSALQRARETLHKKSYRADDSLKRSDTGEQELLAQYIRAWESNDIPSLVTLLQRDAIFSMPPLPQWYLGRERIVEFLQWAWPNSGYTQAKLLPANANCQPAAIFYGREREDADWKPHAIHVLTIRDGKIAVINNFMDVALFSLFDPTPEFDRISPR